MPLEFVSLSQNKNIYMHTRASCKHVRVHCRKLRSPRARVWYRYRVHACVRRASELALCFGHALFEGCRARGSGGRLRLRLRLRLAERKDRVAIAADARGIGQPRVAPERGGEEACFDRVRRTRATAQPVHN